MHVFVNFLLFFLLCYGGSGGYEIKPKASAVHFQWNSVVAVKYTNAASFFQAAVLQLSLFLGFFLFSSHSCGFLGPGSQSSAAACVARVLHEGGQ